MANDQDWEDLDADQKLDRLYLDLKKTMEAINAMERRERVAIDMFAELHEKLKEIEARLPKALTSSE